MKCTFQVGQKVVCIEDEWGSFNEASAYAGPDPVAGDVYTVEQMFADEDGVWIFLSEFPGFVSFHSESFRPAAPRKSDISVFMALLSTTNTPVPV